MVEEKSTMESIMNNTKEIEDLTITKDGDTPVKNRYRGNPQKLLKDLKIVTEPEDWINEEAYDDWLEDLESKARGLVADFDDDLAPAIILRLKPHFVSFVPKGSDGKPRSWLETTRGIAEYLFPNSEEMDKCLAELLSCGSQSTEKRCQRVGKK